MKRLHALIFIYLFVCTAPNALNNSCSSSVLSHDTSWAGEVYFDVYICHTLGRAGMNKTMDATREGFLFLYEGPYIFPRITYKPEQPTNGTTYKQKHS